MEVFKDCPQRRESLRDRLKTEILAMTGEERALLLQSVETHIQHPELTMEECVERAAQVLAHQDGRAEQIKTPDTMSINSSGLSTFTRRYLTST